MDVFGWSERHPNQDLFPVAKLATWAAERGGKLGTELIRSSTRSGNSDRLYVLVFLSASFRQDIRCQWILGTPEAAVFIPRAKIGFHSNASWPELPVKSFEPSGVSAMIRHLR